MDEKNEVIKEEKQSWGKSLWEMIKFAVLALVIVIPIRMFIAQPFIVSGLSMFPTFNDSEYLIVDEISYRFNEPQRGDVVIFRYPKDPSKFFIKRIIGLPGETVLISGNDVTIKNDSHPEGFQLEQPFVTNTANNTLEKEVVEGEYFVMGDNRSASSDSRYWGTLPRKNIIGRAYLRLLPVAEASILPGEHTYEN